MRQMYVRSAFVLGLVAVVAAACGGGAAATPSSGPAGATTAGPRASASAGALAPNPGQSAAAPSTPVVAPVTPGGAPTPAAGAGEPIDACTLLSDKELLDATGAQVLTRRQSTLTQVFPSVCDLSLDDGAEVTIGVRYPGGRQFYESYFEPFIGETGMPLQEELTGVGDKGGRDRQYVMVLQDDVLLEVHYIKFLRVEAEDVALALIRIALGHVPGRGTSGPVSAPTAAAGAAPEVCALLSDAQVQESTGFPVLEREALGSRACRWVLDSGSPFKGAHSISIDIKRSGGRAEFGFLSSLDQVPGIGDGAVKAGGNTDGTVWAVRGDALVKLVYALPISTPDADPIVLPLLELVINAL